MTSILEFENVGASYSGAVVLQNVSFSIEPGETIGLVGRNGAGKTTALLSVFGVPKVTGRILLEGAPAGRHRYDPATRGFSLVPQGKMIFPNLTVQENILLGRASRRRGEWSLERVFELFPNLARGAKRAGNALSGGEQQMLAIARALMAEPKLLMLDEPTEGLAPVIIDELALALEKIRASGTALLIVEQHIPMIQKLASRFIALQKGQIIAKGSVKQLADRDVQELIAL